MPRTVLTPQIIAYARTRVAAGDTAAGLARLLGVRPGTLRMAVRGATWPGAPSPPVVTGDSAARNRRLTSGTVAAARRAVAGGMATIAELARAAGCSYQGMAAAVYGRTWAALEDPPPLPLTRTGQPPANRRLTAGTVARARLSYEAGSSVSQLAARYGVAESTMLSALHGRSWATIARPAAIPARQAGGRPRALSDRDLAAARVQQAVGATLTTIAAGLGVDKSTVCRALRGADGTSAG